MKLLVIFALLVSTFSLTSCIEILDDMQINADGSGVLKYNINLSASKIRINSLLALDSLDGKRVPSLEEIKSEIEKFKTAFDQQNGISAVSLEADYENFLFKLTCNFESVDFLQQAVKNVVEKEYNNEKSGFLLDAKWLIWSNDKLERSIPDYQISKAQKLKPEEIEQLMKGSYISITRFNQTIKSFTNSKALLSKNKMAVMHRENAYVVSQNPKLLENTIYLSNEKP